MEMTKEQIRELSQEMKEVNKDNEQIQKLKEAKGKTPEELLESLDQSNEQPVAEIDPSTGKITVTGVGRGYGFDKKGTLFDDFLIRADDDDDDLQPAKDPDTEFSIEQITKAVNVPGKEIPLGDIYKLRDVLVKKNQKGEIRYSELPDSFKEDINNKALREVGRGMSSQHYNMARNMLSNELIENIYSDIVTEKLSEACIDLDTSIKNLAAEEMGNEHSAQNEQYHNTFVDKFPELAATKYKDDPEKVKLLLGVSEAYKQAQSLELMYEAYCHGSKRMKVKKIEVEKLDKTIRDFEFKYEKSKFTIRDLRMVPEVLLRHVSSGYTEDVVNTFVAVFCKYTNNMKPDNVDEHTFMYYFINNILSLDVPVMKQEDKDYNEKVINSVNHFLGEIKRRKEQQY